MKFAGGVATGVLGTVLVGGAGWWLVAAKPGDAGKSAPPPIPAKVDKPFKEDQAATITLTADAEARLGIKTAPVERKSVKRVRTFGGETAVPPGRTVIVSAPLAGNLKPVPGIDLAAGVVVKPGQPLFQLVPLLDPIGRANLIASRVDAEGQVLNAAEQLKAAIITLERAKKVLDGGAGRQRDVDDAQAAVELAKKLSEAAVARRDLLKKVTGEAESGTTATIPMTSPQAGVIRSVSALSGETVPAGAALFEIMDLATMWVRTPVYVGDAAELDLTAPARVGPLTAKPGDPTSEAKPVPAPPVASPVPGTVDLLFEMDNRTKNHRPGERLGVTIPLKESADSLVVPWSAVVFDIHGGAWAYERTGERVYSRKRVVVRFMLDSLAVLDSGPAPGSPIVTVGAAELFGTDAGFSK